MKRTTVFKRLIVAFSCIGLLGGQFAQAANRIGDVALQPGGRLQGQVLDQQGTVQPHARVTIGQQGEAVAVTQTNDQGHFAVHGLPAGVYQVHTEMGVGVYRLWAPQTAPPAAQDSILLVHSNNVVRGVVGGGPGPVAPAYPPAEPTGGGWMSGLGFLANPWVLAAIVAAAIAIPLAVDGDAS